MAKELKVNGGCFSLDRKAKGKRKKEVGEESRRQVSYCWYCRSSPTTVENGFPLDLSVS